MIKHDTHKHRQAIRLPGYDYSQAGMYFVTICIYNRICILGRETDGKIELNAYGVVVDEEWIKTEEIRRNEVGMDAYVIMPNHIHGIIAIRNDDNRESYVGATRRSPWNETTGAGGPAGGSPLRRMRGPSPRSLGAILGGFKSAAATRINQLRGTPGMPVWQRNYYEHVIRNDEELNLIRQYIENNPLRWKEDKNHPERIELKERV